VSKHKYDDEFRKQIVDLVESKIKTVKEIVGEYTFLFKLYIHGLENIKTLLASEMKIN